MLEDMKAWDQMMAKLAEVECLIEFHCNPLDRSLSAKSLSTKSGKKLIERTFKVYEERTKPLIDYFSALHDKFHRVAIMHEVEFEESLNEFTSFMESRSKDSLTRNTE